MADADPASKPGNFQGYFHDAVEYWRGWPVSENQGVLDTAIAHLSEAWKHAYPEEDSREAQLSFEYLAGLAFALVGPTVTLTALVKSWVTTDRPEDLYKFRLPGPRDVKDHQLLYPFDERGWWSYQYGFTDNFDAIDDAQTYIWQFFTAGTYAVVELLLGRYDHAYDAFCAPGLIILGSGNVQQGMLDSSYLYNQYLLDAKPFVYWLAPLQWQFTDAMTEALTLYLAGEKRYERTYDLLVDQALGGGGYVFANYVQGKYGTSLAQEINP